MMGMSKEERRMSERVQAVRRLSQEFEGVAGIPEEELHKIDYVRIELPDGGWHAIPVEQLAMRSLEERRKSHERQSKGLFGELQFEVKANKGYDTTLLPEVILHQVERLVTDIEDDLDFEWMHNNALTQVEDRFSRRRILGQDMSGKKLPMRTWIADGFKAGFITDVLADLTGLSDERGWDVLIHQYLGIDVYAERFTSSQSEDIWTKLEILKSRLGDVEILEEKFKRTIGVFLFMERSEARDDLKIAESISVVPLEQYASQFLLADPSEQEILLRSLPLYMHFVAKLLDEDGFNDVAERMRQAESVQDARQVIAEALKSCERVRQFKDMKKAMLSRRKSLHDEEAIYSFSRELAAFSKEQKEAMKTLYGLQAFFDIPNLFSKYIHRQITTIQRGLQVTRSDELVTIHLDSRPDREKDEDPGVISGDCTAGRPLPFNAGVGIHNVKAYLNGEHTGNIYLADSTTENGERVWHLDAVQIPSLRPDWGEFASKLVDQLAAIAAENGVDLITINNKPHHVSNYDYIARSLLAYVEARDAEQVRFDQDDLPIEDDAVVGDSTKEVDVIFPEMTDNRSYSSLQGERESQLVMWRRPV
jgi:hypothetical protein